MAHWWRRNEQEETNGRGSLTKLENREGKERVVGNLISSVLPLFCEEKSFPPVFGHDLVGDKTLFRDCHESATLSPHTEPTRDVQKLGFFPSSLAISPRAADVEDRLRFHSPLLKEKSGQTNTSFRLLSDALGYRHPLFTCRDTGSTFLSPFRESYVSLLSDYIPHSRLTLSPLLSPPRPSADLLGASNRPSLSPLPLPKEGRTLLLSSLWRRSFGVPFFSLALLFAAGGGDNTCHEGGERLRRSWTHLEEEEELLSSLAQGGARAASSLPPPFIRRGRGWPCRQYWPEIISYVFPREMFFMLYETYMCCKILH